MKRGSTDHGHIGFNERLAFSCRNEHHCEMDILTCLERLFMQSPEFSRIDLKFEVMDWFACGGTSGWMLLARGLFPVATR